METFSPKQYLTPPVDRKAKLEPWGSKKNPVSMSPFGFHTNDHRELTVTRNLAWPT